MGESKNNYFCVEFNKKLRVNFNGARVTSDGGFQFTKGQAVACLFLGDSPFSHGFVNCYLEN